MPFLMPARARVSRSDVPVSYPRRVVCCRTDRTYRSPSFVTSTRTGGTTTSRSLPAVRIRFSSSAMNRTSTSAAQLGIDLPLRATDSSCALPDRSCMGAVIVGVRAWSRPAFRSRVALSKRASTRRFSASSSSLRSGLRSDRMTRAPRRPRRGTRSSRRPSHAGWAPSRSTCPTRRGARRGMTEAALEKSERVFAGCADLGGEVGTALA
jgi:hypothetical protein